MAGHRARRSFVLVALALEACSAWLLLGMAPGIMETLIGLALHGGASALLVWAVSGTPATQARAILCGVVALLAFPLVGMVGMVAGILATASSAPRMSELASPPNPADAAGEPPGADVRRPVDVERELAVEPIVDVLRDDDIDVKRGAIDAAVRADRRFAVGILQELIRDPHGDVRLYASIALSRLEDDIAREMLLARQVASDSPTDAVARERLAALYVDYGLSGLLNDGARRRFFDLARDEYEVACELAPDDGGPVAALGRVHALRGETGAARAGFANALARDPRCLDAHLGLMELAFESGDVDGIVGHAGDALPWVGRDHPRRALVEWWALTGEVPSG